MLILLPVILLLVGSMVVQILSWTRPGFGISWLVASGTALAAWVVVLAWRLTLPLSLSLGNWQQALFNTSPVIIVDHATWTYAISLASLVLVVLLTDAARAQSSFPTSTWSGSLALGAMGILAVSSGNPFTLLITWSAIDILEVAILLISPAGQRTSRQVVAAFSARVFGTMALVGAMMLTPEIAGSFSLLNLPVTVNVLLLLACGLRLGVFPPNLPLMREPRLQRGLGSLLRLIPASTSLILLVRLPEGIQAGSWQPVFVAVLTMTALISSLVWSLSKDEVAGRAYWVAGWASLAIMCVVQGIPSASLAYGAAMLLPGGLLFLYSVRTRLYLFLPALGIWVLSGLPFSPTASGWQGLQGTGFSVWTVVSIMALDCLILGFIRHAFRSEEPGGAPEKWMRAIYPLALLLLALTSIVLGIWGWVGSRTVGIWWIALPNAVLLAGVVVAVMRARRRMGVGLQRIGRFVAMVTSVLRLNWLYQAAGAIYRIISEVLNWVTVILEGDGGVLWALLALALLVSLSAVGGR